MLSSASTTVNKQVLGVSPTGWYGNFSDTLVWRVICRTQSRRYLLSATCLSPSVPAPRVSLRTCVIPRWRYSFTRETDNFHRLFKSDIRTCQKIWTLYQRFANYFVRERALFNKKCTVISKPRLKGPYARCKGKGKTVPLQAWSGPEGLWKLRFPDYMTTAQDGDKVVSLTHRPPLPPRKCSWYLFMLEAESNPGP